MASKYAAVRASQTQIHLSKLVPLSLSDWWYYPVHFRCSHMLFKFRIIHKSQQCQCCFLFSVSKVEQIWYIRSHISESNQVKSGHTNQKNQVSRPVILFGLKFFHISNQYKGNYIKLHQFVTNWRETNFVRIFFSAISEAIFPLFLMTFKMFAGSINRNVNPVGLAKDPSWIAHNFCWLWLIFLRSSWLGTPQLFFAGLFGNFSQKF